FLEKKKKRYCYNCYGFGHLAKSCKSPKKCGKCSESVKNNIDDHQCSTTRCSFCQKNHESWKCKTLLIESKSSKKSYSDVVMESNERNVALSLLDHARKFSKFEQFQQSIFELIMEAWNQKKG